MPDREKVELGIKACWSEYFSHKCCDCPYMSDRNDRKCIERLGADALALLKEQDAVEGHWIPIESPTGVEAFGIKEMTVQVVRCSVCSVEEDVSFATYRFCPRCGAKMKGR